MIGVQVFDLPVEWGGWEVHYESGRPGWHSYESYVSSLFKFLKQQNITMTEKTPEK